MKFWALGLSITYLKILCSIQLVQGFYRNCLDIFKQQAPQFQIISAAKTGSTSLYSYLCQKPSIECLAKKKELNLLRSANIQINTRQERSKALQNYLKSGFNAKSLGGIPSVSFEASIHYYHHKNALENMHALLPCSRLIWILRNPLPRAVSEYLHQAVKSRKYPSFKDLVTREIAAIHKCKENTDVENYQLGFENGIFSCLGKFKLKKYMISSAFYGYFISAWLEKFPREQHLFLDYEEFKKDPQSAVEKITAFLTLPPPPKLNFTWIYNKANTRDGVAQKLRAQIRLSSAEKKMIIREITPFIRHVYEVVGDLNWTIDSLS